MNIEEMSRDEKSFLLYAETRAVDHGGLLDMRQCNQEDAEIGKKWNDSGFMEYKRFTKRDADGDVESLTYRVVLSDEAWETAHKIRRDRAERNLKQD